MLCKCSGKYIDIYFNLKITFLSGGSAVPGYSGCQTEPPSLQTPVCTKSRTGLWFQEGEEDAVPHEPGLAQESSSTARVTVYYRVKGEPKNFLSNHGFFFHILHVMGEG